MKSNVKDPQSINQAKLQVIVSNCKHINTRIYTESTALSVLIHNMYVCISTYIHISATYNMVSNSQVVENNEYQRMEGSDGGMIKVLMQKSPKETEENQ